MKFSLPRPEFTAIMKCAAALCFLFSAAGCQRADAPEAEPVAVDARPNVIVVVVDTLRQDALRTYAENAQALPALDAFSARAAVFENALATSSWTLPSVTSMLTGMYPDRHGVAHPRLALPEGVQTIATAAHEAGYETVMFSDGVYVSTQFGLAPGFDWFNDESTPDARAMPDLPRGGEPHPVPGTTLFDRGLHYLNAREPGDKPFFLMLHTYSVHDYFREHPWATAEVGERPVMEAEGIFCLIDNSFCVDGIWPYFEALYDAEIRYLDKVFDTLMSTLDARGLTDSTYVLLTSDHGEGFDPENGRVHHGGRLHEDVIRIPFLLAGPDVAPRRIADPVSLVDIMPTLLDIFDVKPGDRVEGVSLMPALAGERIPDRNIFAEEYFYWWRDGARKDVMSIAVFPLAEAVLSGGRWYTRHQSEAGLTDLIPGTPPLTPEAAQATAAQMVQILRAHDTRLKPGDSRAEDPELQEKLQSLGYIN